HPPRFARDTTVGLSSSLSSVSRGGDHGTSEPHSGHSTMIPREQEPVRVPVNVLLALDLEYRAAGPARQSLSIDAVLDHLHESTSMGIRSPGSSRDRCRAVM